MTWTVSDGRGGTASADLVVTVEGGNNPPVWIATLGTFNLSSISSSYWFGFNRDSYFSDPDGDSYTIFITQPGSGSITSYGSSGCNFTACWIYSPPSNWNGSPYQTSATIYARDEHGAESQRRTLTLCVNC
jgi:hypothetical protein